jgi:hypothetical protein
VSGRAAAGVLLGWAALGGLVQRWASFETGVREGFAADVPFYESIARAAPGFPDTPVLRAYAQRFPSHWLAGVVADLTGAGLHPVYRVATPACVLAALLLLHLALRRLGLDVRAHALALGALAASAYPVHYLLAAPGMLSDAVFVLGLSLACLGLVSGSTAGLVGGPALALLGRQTALPAAVAVAAAVLLRRRRDGAVAAAACVAVPALLYLALHVLSDGFSEPRPAGVDDLTVLGFLTGVRAFGEHVALVALGVAVPTALVAGAWLRARGPLPWGPLLVAASVVAQPLLLGPLANRSNEPRLAGLAAPPLALAAALVLRRVRLGTLETAVCAVAIAAAGLHPRYTRDVLASSGAWAAVELVAAGLVLAVLARPRAPSPPSRR